jgi:hypothetical protein
MLSGPFLLEGLTMDAQTNYDLLCIVLGVVSAAMFVAGMKIGNR